jgi:PAS domain S-box-containing protein
MSASPIRVLLVEDDDIDRMAFVRHVDRQSLPYICKTANSVAAAKAIPASEAFDIVILDHNLNDGTGFDLLDHFAHAPILFLTGSESPEVAVRAMKAGAADYLLKDHDRNYLQLLPVAVERAMRARKDREQLIESQELFRQSFSEAPIGKAFLAPRGRFLRVNRALCEMFGYSEPQFLASDFQLICSNEETARIEKLFPSHAAPDRIQRTEMHCRHKLGNEIWIQIDIARVLDNRGQASSYVAQIQDITGRKRAEAEIREAKEYAENIINTAPTIICGLSPDGTTRFVNPATTRICDYPAQEIVGRNWWKLFYPGDSQAQAERLRFQAEQGPVLNQITTLTVRDGTKRVISWSSMNHRAPNGSIIEIVGIGMDITAQAQAEEVRTRLETQLYQSQKMEALGSLAGGVAHEFNNMLGAIIGYTELARMELGSDNPSVSHLDEVLNASQRARDIIQQVLTFSRRQDLKRELINLQRIASEAVKLVRPGISPSIEITSNIPPNCPPVFGNLSQLQQALTNLMTNARDAMKPEGGCISLTAKVVALTRETGGSALGLPDGRYSVLAITDNGLGMDAATRDRVFEPFFTTKGPGKGSGLGMAVVHGIMKSHDGSVGVESEVGRGTTVSLYFPAPTTGADEKAPVQKPTVPMGYGERILFVDDEVALGTIATRILQPLGYRVTAFTSASDAVAAFAARPNDFDIVITDLTMPGMTGMALADALRETRPDIPILLATGYVEESVREQASLLGFREILAKPLSRQQLAEALRRALGKKD